MKQHLRDVLIVAAVVAAAGAVFAQTAQSKPNFSGRWVPSPKVDGASEMEIKQDATTISIGHEMGEGHDPHRNVYKLDGSETKQPNPAHPEITDVSKASWDGNRLVIVNTFPTGVQQTIVLWLDQAGLLVTEVTLTGPGREPEMHKASYKKM